MERSSNNGELRINLYGKTGAGKSTLGNTILGYRNFEVGHSITSCTNICEDGEVKWPGIAAVKVIDTPGFGDN